MLLLDSATYPSDTSDFFKVATTLPYLIAYQSTKFVQFGSDYAAQSTLINAVSRY